MEGLDIPAPEYKLRESPHDIVLAINAPLCKSNEASVFLEKKIVTFESHPYFLRVKLPCRVIKEGIEEDFDEKTGTYSLTFKKLRDGKDESESESNENHLSEVLDCCNDPHQDSDEKESLNNEISHYGFLNLYSCLFGRYYKEFSQVIDLPDPDHTNAEERTALRIKEENEKWNEDHYLADLMESEHLEPLFHYVPPWVAEKPGNLNEEEKDIFENLTKCEWLESDLDEEKMTLAELNMIDILLAYCYNKRSTEGENTVESSWTISKLSSSLSWFEVFPDLKTVLISFYRRSLTYPLYRNWNFTKVIHKDVTDLLKSDRDNITRCFIEMKELFDESECCHIFNMLYINHLCYFSRLISSERLNELAKELEKMRIKKCDVLSDLIFLEMAAKAALEEENNEMNEELAKKRIDELVEEISALSFDTTGEYEFE